MNKFFIGLGVILVATAVVLAVFGQSIVTSDQSNVSVKWHNDLNSALQEAKNTNIHLYRFLR